MNLKKLGLMEELEEFVVPRIFVSVTARVAKKP